MSPTASKNITLFIFSWSVSSRGSGLYQDLLKLTIIQFQQINWNLFVPVFKLFDGRQSDFLAPFVHT